MTRPLKLAVIAGEVSGDLLGGDLVAALRRQLPDGVALVGVGGEAKGGGPDRCRLCYCTLYGFQ